MPHGDWCSAQAMLFFSTPRKKALLPVQCSNCIIKVGGGMRTCTLAFLRVELLVLEVAPLFVAGAHFLPPSPPAPTALPVSVSNVLPIMAKSRSRLVARAASSRRSAGSGRQVRFSRACSSVWPGSTSKVSLCQVTHTLELHWPTRCTYLFTRCAYFLKLIKAVGLNQFQG